MRLWKFFWISFMQNGKVENEKKGLIVKNSW